MTTAAPGAATGVAVTDSTPPTRSTRRAKATPGRLRCAMPKKAARVANPALSSRSRNGGGSDGGEKQTSPGPAHRRGRTVRAFQDPCDVSDEGRPQALAPLVHCGQALADGGAPQASRASLTRPRTGKRPRKGGRARSSAAVTGSVGVGITPR